MPIGKDEWKSGRTRDTMETKILQFLKKKYPQAYNVAEIAQAFDRTPNFTESDELGDKIRKGILGGFAMNQIESKLENLVREGVVEKQTIQEQFGETDYYRARQDQS